MSFAFGHFASIGTLERRIRKFRNMIAMSVALALQDSAAAYEFHMGLCIQERRVRFAVMPHTRANCNKYQAYFQTKLQSVLLTPRLPHLGVDVAWLIAQYAYEPSVFLL